MSDADCVGLAEPTGGPGPNLTWAGLTVNQGTVCTFTYRVVVTMTGQPAGSTLSCPEPLTTNSAILTPSFSSVLDDNACVIVSFPAVDPTIVKTVSPDTITNGSSTTYTLTVTNPAASSITNLDVTDTLPTGFTFNSMVGTSTCTASAPTISGQTQTWSNFSLAAGSSCTLIFIVDVNLTLSAGTTVDCGTAGDPTMNIASVFEAGVTPAISSDDACISVTEPGGNPGLFKSANPSPVVNGDTVTYTLTLIAPIDGNGDPSLAVVQNVTDTIPTGGTYNGTWSTDCHDGGSTVVSTPPTWTPQVLTIPDLYTPYPLISCTYVYEVAVNVPGLTVGQTTSCVVGSEVFQNTVSAAYFDKQGNNFNLTDETCVEVVEPDNPVITKSVNLSSVFKGDTVQYNLVITNPDPSTQASGTFEVVDTLPTGFSYVNNSTISACTTPSSNANPTVSGQNLTWTVTALPGGTCVILFDVLVDPASGTLPIACADPLGTNEVDLYDVGQTTLIDEANVCTSVTERPNPTFTKVSNVATVDYNGQITYTLEITNPTDSGVTTFAIQDTLPAGFTFESGSATGSCSAGQPTVSGSPEVLSWASINLVQNSNCTVVYTVNVTPSSAVAGTDMSCPDGVITNAAVLTFADDSSPLNASVCVPITVGEPTITKLSTTPNVNRGGTANYILSITNPSNSPVTAFNLVDTLPTGFTHNAGTLTINADCVQVGSETISGQTMDFDVTLAAGDSCTASYSTTANPTGTAALDCAATTNTVVMSYTGGSVQDTACVPVNPIVLSLSKTANASQVLYLETLTYTITLNTTGGSITDNVVDTLPTDFNFVAGSTTGSCGVGAPAVSGTPEVLTWSSVTVNGTCNIIFEVAVNQAGTAGTTTTCPDNAVTNSVAYFGDTATVCTEVIYGQPFFSKSVQPTTQDRGQTCVDAPLNASSFSDKFGNVIRC